MLDSAYICSSEGLTFHFHFYVASSPLYLLIHFHIQLCIENKCRRERISHLCNFSNSQSILLCVKVKVIDEANPRICFANALKQTTPFSNKK